MLWIFCSKKCRTADHSNYYFHSEVLLRSSKTEDLVDGVREGDVRSLARVLTMVENGHPLSHSIMHSLYDPDRKGLTVGVTGPPGAGKSTLTSRLIDNWRKKGNRVGVIAVDPSSPFSGGALLGDRVRMQSHASDPKVFIRSMGSRGHLGGVSAATRDGLEVLSSAGFDPVIVETVGVGQAEVEIASLADITLLVLVPGLGDEVQTMKAGIMEIGDVIVLNKSDRAGIDMLETAVRASLELIPHGQRKPAVVRCSAQTGEGMEELREEIAKFVSQRFKREEMARRRTSLILGSIIQEKGREIAGAIISDEYGGRDEAVESILSGDTTPYGIGLMITEYMRKNGLDPDNAE
ncbi:MAG: methylmalonyl Co-A mutase-associated GTPase MeaB [Candidatus Aegiribacteria sp.]|nr:methylmalonyl Co-A mutase-associated GTPase MeaB [Candidatus Aegiribacteria sp.]MBD3294657.1 methylmalonyl Co-A mutase-associated GTPase MeaB [Candidatus Fermentibacteria bacterium]